MVGLLSKDERLNVELGLSSKRMIHDLKAQ
jgi:hypothetical protein